jgi:nucleoside-diphosphate-sugar epimerase
VLEFARIIVELAGSRSPIVHVPGREGDIDRRMPDASRAQVELGWAARTTLEDGLARTIDWYRLQLAGEEAGAPVPAVEQSR